MIWLVLSILLLRSLPVGNTDEKCQIPQKYYLVKTLPYFLNLAFLYNVWNFKQYKKHHIGNESERCRIVKILIFRFLSQEHFQTVQNVQKVLGKDNETLF